MPIRAWPLICFSPFGGFVRKLHVLAYRAMLIFWPYYHITVAANLTLPSKVDCRPHTSLGIKACIRQFNYK